ncbi:MAG: MFS transporter [Clostridia bacterium]
MAWTVRGGKLIRRRLGTNLLLLLLGSGVSTFGNALVLVALLVHLAGFADSASLIGLVQGSAYLPMALFSYAAGVWVDRHSPRRVMIWTDALRGLAMMAGGCLLAVLPGSGAGLVVILPLVFVLGTLQSFFIPGVVVLCVDVEHQFASDGRFVRVLGLRNAGTHGATLAGNAIGGSLYLLLGLPALLVYSGLGFILSAISELFLQESPRTGTGSSPLPPRLGIRLGLETRQGTDPKPRSSATFPAELRAVICTPPVDLYLLVQVLIPLLTMLLPSFIGQVLGLPAQALGLVFALLLAGSITAGLSSGLRKQSSHPYLPGLMAGLLLAAIAVPGKALPLPLGAIGLAGLGYCLGSLYLHSIEAVQNASLPGRGGRGHGMLESLSSILTPASYFIGAALLGSGMPGVGRISASFLVAGLAGTLVVYSLVAGLLHPIPRS